MIVQYRELDYFYGLRAMEQDSITVYATRWCPDCFRAKMILNKYGISYRWIDINRDSQAKELVAKINNGYLSVPTLVFEDGSILSEPSNQELINKIEQDLKPNDD